MLYSRTVRFSFLHNTYCRKMQYGQCGNRKILLTVGIAVMEQLSRKSGSSFAKLNWNENRNLEEIRNGKSKGNN